MTFFTYENVPMRRIHDHWTAGSYNASELDLKHYHFLTEGDGTHRRGKPTVAANSGSLKNGYAAHTLNANTDAIGTSMCGMGDAEENPFDAGKWPLREEQFEAHMQLLAEIATFYNIPVTPKTILTHAEVQTTLGIKQRGKWDYTRLPFRPDLIGAKTCGDFMRSRVKSYMGESTVNEPVPEGARGVVVTNGSHLNMRSAASINASDIGDIPNGTPVEILAVEGDGWYLVRTPADYTGFVSADFVMIVDGPPATNPTKPDPRRIALEKVRDALDELEATF